MSVGDGDELCKLYDKLNLTGRVIRIGQHSVAAGGCAYVWEARLSPHRKKAECSEGEGEKVAVKVIREVGSSANETSLRKRLIREVRAWSTLYHRNVLPLLGFTYGFNPGSRLASLVSPWMPNGTARQYLERRSASERIRVLTGVADGLCYLHRHDVVHGDLKGDNIMINSKYEPLIADFGLSKLLDEVSNTLTVSHTGNALGSVRWTAQELFFSPGVNFESDIWSFGMTILELFTNAPPYRHLKHDAQVIITVHKGVLPVRPRPSTGMDDALWEVCCDCWNWNPQLRPSTRVIAKRLWDLDLKCKLQSRNKRRASPSPERDRGRNARGGDETQVQGEREEEGRLRKSPKLEALAEFAGDKLPPPSPGAPLRSQRDLVRVPVSRSSTPSSQPASGSSTRTVSTPSFIRNSRSTFVDETADPRRLFTTMHSDGDIFATNLHSQQQQQQYHTQLQRTQSEPVGLDLTFAGEQQQPFVVDEFSGLGLGLSFDPSLAMTPRQECYDSFGTPPSNEFAHLYPQFAMQQQQHPFLANGNNAFDPLSQAQFLSGSDTFDPLAQPEFFGGYDTDTMHPSQWTSSFPPYTHAGFTSATYPPLLQNGNGSLYIDESTLHAHAQGMQGQAHYAYSGSTSPFLLPPPPGPPSGELDNGFGYGYGHSPLLENGFPSPHALGPLFSENFFYEEPQSISPYTSPLFNGSTLLNDPLYNDTPIPPYPNHHHQNPYRHQPASRGTVDFNSLQNGVFSPALSDLSAPSPSPPPVDDTPVMNGFGDDFAFGDDSDEGEVLEEGLALFGGLDVSGEFGSRRHPNPAPVMPADPDQTPHGSPQLLQFAGPMTLRAGHQPQAANGDAGAGPHTQQQMRMPPTPRLSPLLSSF